MEIIIYTELDHYTHYYGQSVSHGTGDGWGNSLGCMRESEANGHVPNLYSSSSGYNFGAGDSKGNNF